ncbi:hypothetical protein QTP88_024193 [Uroleucon formosanum]
MCRCGTGGGGVKRGEFRATARAVGPIRHWCVSGTPPVAPTAAAAPARYPHRETGAAASRPPGTRPRPGPVQAGRRSGPLRLFLFYKLFSVRFRHEDQTVTSKEAVLDKKYISADSPLDMLLAYSSI